MKYFVLLLVTVAALGTRAQSQNGSSKALIKELFVVMHQDSMMLKMMDAMSASMAKQMTASLSNMDAANAKGFTDAMEKSLVSSKEMTFKLINEDLIDIYDRYFTPEEIRQFIMFYKTAAGQKMIGMTPAITKDIMNIMSVKYTPAIQQALHKDLEKAIGEIKPVNKN